MNRCICLCAGVMLLGAPVFSTPLHQAVRARDIAKVRTLLQSHAYAINAVIADGVTPLHLAAATDQADIAALLIERGADVNSASTTGFTPLHWAASRDSMDTIRLLLKAGGNINAKAQNNITPLHWAAAKNAAKAVEALIAAGSDITAVTTTGLTPLQLAVKHASHPEMSARIATLENTLQVMNDAMARDAERLKQMEQDLGQARQAHAELAAHAKEQGGRKADIRESDLYKDLEQINSILREKLIGIESERQRLALAEENAARLNAEQQKTIGMETQARTKAEAALKEALAREGEYQELIERLVPQVDDLEKQVTALAQERQSLTNRMRDRDEDLHALKMELERREYRLAKAERVAEVLEKARTEVMQAGDRDKLDMHYNMASVYAREGKPAEAEREYLRALRIDPTDADVHYNLGILYDDELKQPEKATMHYRRHLQLSPHGPDADRVRNWLMKLEMRTQR